MGAKIKRDFSFLGCVFFGEQFIMNSYDVTCFMQVISEDIVEQTVALERMKYFFEFMINDTVFVQNIHQEKIDQLTEMGFKVSPLPDEPVDQAVAIALISKLNAITEYKFVINSVELVSQIGDSVTFIVHNDDEFPSFVGKNNWYNDPSVSVSSAKKKTTKRDKIVKLSKSQTDWEKLGLGWSQKENVPTEITFSMDLDK